MKRLVLLALAAMVTIGSSAQETPPNETDLFAAYCIGFFNSSIPKLQKQASGPTAELAKEMQGSLEAAKKKTIGYLLPRSQHIDAAGLAAASKQAEEDYKALEGTTGSTVGPNFAKCMSVSYLPY